MSNGASHGQLNLVCSHEPQRSGTYHKVRQVLTFALVEKQFVFAPEYCSNIVMIVCILFNALKSASNVHME